MKVEIEYRIRDNATQHSVEVLRCIRNTMKANRKMCTYTQVTDKATEPKIYNFVFSVKWFRAEDVITKITNALGILVPDFDYTNDLDITISATK